MQPTRLPKTASTLAALVGFLFASTPLRAQTTLFADTFDRPDGADLNASNDGKSGTLGQLNWVQLGVGGGMEILGNQLKGGDNGAAAGWGLSYIDHNFVDANIASGGGFSVSIDLLNYASAGSGRWMAIAVGQSKSELDSWATNNAVSTPSDLFVGYRWTQKQLEVYINGTLVAEPDISAYAVPQTLRVDYALADFKVGSTVNYEAYLGSDLITSGSFTWSGTDENYIGIFTNLSARQARMDNIEILANADSSPPTFPLTINRDGVGGYDLAWTSQSGMLYDLRSSTDLSTAISSWTLVEGGIPASGTGTNTSNVTPSESRLFYAVEEYAAPPVIVLSEDFEASDGGFTSVNLGTGTEWAYGAPTSPDQGGGAVTSGNGGSAKCWGTDIGSPGGYIAGTDTVLRSPVIDLTGVAGATLSFAQALDIKSPHSLVVNVIEAASDTVLQPAVHTSTPDTNTGKADWNTVAAVAITGGQPVRIEWRFAGDGDGTYLGAYIDDVVLTHPAP